MKRVILLSAVALPLFIKAQTVAITADRGDCLYKCGEPTTFSINVLDASKQPATSGELNVTLSNYGTQQVASARFDLSQGNPVTVVGTLREPGFLKCTAVARLDNNVRALWGVAYEPEKIRTGSERPADFDAFWDAAILRLAAEVPLDPRVEHVAKWSNEKHDGYRVSFATFDNLRVYGFLAVPKGQGPFPVEVNVPGAGPGQVAPVTGMADRGFIHLVMNVHPFEPAADIAAQKALYSAQDKRVKEQFGVPRYCHSGAASRETYFFYRIMLGINRAVDWVAARPDVDKSRFHYSGSSQGGGFGFYLLGLNKNFTRGVIHVPAITDLLGFQAGRDSGWPKLIENMRASDREAAIATAHYVDGAHFAPRITCPVRVSVGFIDDTCPPPAVYAGYNALRVKDREIAHGIGMPHSVSGELRKRLDEAWLRGK